MTDLDLEAIRERVEAASAAPWTAHPDGLVWASRLGDPVSGSTEVGDAEFIAAARQDIPALVAEVERLQRLTGPDSLPAVDAYETAMRKLADATLALGEERAEVVVTCNRLAAAEGDRDRLAALLGEVLGTFRQVGGEQMAWSSVRVETLTRWRHAVVTP